MMKHTLTLLAALLCCTLQSRAIDNNTVEVVYSGTTATVTVAGNIASYVTVSSGTAADVVVKQTNTDLVDNDEITYILSGSSADGSFKLSGSFKCTVSLAGLTLTNADGPALNILNGKRVKVSAKKDTENTISGYGTSTYNGAIYCKGHIELQGNGVLNVSSDGYHAIKAKEYCQVKNLTLNITGAAKDGINCQEYFWMKSGTVTMTNIGSDGIDVSMDGTTAVAVTDAEHEDENTGNFYQDGGTLTIALASSNTTGSLIQATGTVTHSAGTFNGETFDSAVRGIEVDGNTPAAIYDLSGRRRQSGDMQRGLYIIKGNKTTKTIVK